MLLDTLDDMESARELYTTLGFSEIVPVPLLCTLWFGSPLKLAAGEDKTAFIERTRAALLALSPPEG